MNFNLADGDARHAAHPTTFHMPSLDARLAIKPGDHVKLMFMTGLKDAPGAERMWVNVTRINSDASITGSIANDPVYVNARLGDPVTFEHRHIINIEH